MKSVLHTGLLPAALLIRKLRDGVFDGRLRQFYGDAAELSGYRVRIAAAVGQFCELYGDRPLCVFSVSGRTELGGNHTDHQNGRVLAGGISADILAAAAPADDAVMRVCSEGYPPDAVSCSDLTVHTAEAGTSAALLRGVAAAFAGRGIRTGGFYALLTSDVPKGSGLSSSAAYEVLTGCILNRFYARDLLTPTELAMAAQHAETVYFGKPCGLMDQMACALGGAAAMDFADPAHPVCERLTLDPEANGYALCIIETGADHAGLTDEYAAIPAEMGAVAAVLGAQVLRETDEACFWEKLPEIRRQCGDRAVLRAIHFYRENERVLRQTAALKRGDFAGFLRLVQESGQSSALYLQNLTVTGSTRNQAVAFALALTGRLLAGQGAGRVHGGGFAGTVQAYVPLSRLSDFRTETERLLGEGSCHVLRIRSIGASALWDCEGEETICC